jgi:hypothetical protein
MVDAAYDAAFPRFGEFREGELFRVKSGEHAGKLARKIDPAGSPDKKSNAKLLDSDEYILLKDGDRVQQSL